MSEETMQVSVSYDFHAIRISPNGTIGVEKTKKIAMGDETIHQPANVYFNPGGDLSDAPAVVQEIANAIWTEEFLADYEAAKIPEPEVAVTQPSIF
jgi:hypothetical protein